MGRFRPKKTVRLVAHLRDAHLEQTPSWKREEEGLSRDLHDHWNTLHRHCDNQLSQLRLGRLIHRLTHYDPGVRESALAELELAMQLIRAGVRVTFLPESQARSADLNPQVVRRLFVYIPQLLRLHHHQMLQKTEAQKLLHRQHCSCSYFVIEKHQPAFHQERKKECRPCK